MGDFNARCGLLDDTHVMVDVTTPTSESDPAMSIFPKWIFKDEPVGKYLVAFCQMHEMVILNGRLPGDGVARATYHCTSIKPSPGQAVPTGVIDLAVCSHNLFQCVRNLRVADPTPMTDHSLVLTELELPRGDVFRKIKMKSGQRQCRWEHEQRSSYDMAVAEVEVQAELQRIVMAASGSDYDFDSAAKQICNTLAKVTRRVFPSRKQVLNTLPEWWDEDIERRRGKLYHQYKHCRHHPLTKALKKAYKRCQALKALDFRRTRERKLFKLLLHEGQRFYKIFRAKQKLIPLLDPEPWCGHFEGILTTQPPGPEALGGETRELLLQTCRDKMLDLVPPSEFHSLNDPISVTEVLQMLRKADNNKSTADGVPLELFKYAQALLPGTTSKINWTASHVAQLLTEAYLVKRRLPSDMYEAFVIPVYKGKGDDKVMDNYRGITITTSLYKIFTTILTRRADALCEKYEMRAMTQCGFRNKHGTIDAIFALNHHIHTTCTPLRQGGLGQPLKICFIDFQKAFDCVVRT